MQNTNKIRKCLNRYKEKNTLNSQNQAFESYKYTVSIWTQSSVYRRISMADV